MIYSHPPAPIHGSSQLRPSSPLSVVEASDHHRVPQRVHLATAVVHDPGQPRVDGLRTVAVSVTQQLLVDAADHQAQRPGQCPQPAVVV